MSNSKQRMVLAVVVAAAVAVGLGSAASAGTRWQAHHPWRAQVNHRLGNLNARINRERREGELTPGQAATLHGQVHTIRQAERAMAAGQQSHLTRGEWGALNAHENMVSRQVGR